jgi:hypothetical protein
LSPGQYRDIVATQMGVDSAPIYSIYVWSGDGYRLDRYEFCGVVFEEYCDTPVEIRPLSGIESQGLVVMESAVVRASPAAEAPPVRFQDEGGPGIIGVLANDPNWYLVWLWKGFCGFVESRFVRSSG